MDDSQSLTSLSPATVIGHRGACGHAPENTRASIRKASALGASWVEFDVRISRDRVAVLSHDDTQSRTIGTDVAVSELNIEAIKALDAGSWFDPSYAGETIPTLTETLSLLGELSLGANVEVKSVDENIAETAHHIARQLRAEWPRTSPPPLVSSFSEDILQGFLEAAPEIDRALLVKEIPSRWAQCLSELKCVALHCHHDFLTQGMAAEIISAGYALRCYTVNDPERAAELLRWGVSSVVTDYPDRIFKHLAAVNE